MVQQRLEAYHLGPAHQCFFHHLDRVIASVLKIGRFSGLGTEGLLVGKINKKVVEKKMFPKKNWIFSKVKETPFFFCLHIFYS